MILETKLREIKRNEAEAAVGLEVEHLNQDIDQEAENGALPIGKSKKEYMKLYNFI